MITFWRKTRPNATASSRSIPCTSHDDSRHTVLRDLLILGCYRVEQCVGYEEDPEGTWREPSWLVHGMDREESIAFGRVFRQNAVLVCQAGRPEIIVTDPTCDDIGKAFFGNWRVRA